MRLGLAVLATVASALLLAPLLAPAAQAAPPQPLLFNGTPSADVRGPVLAVAADGPGRWGAVAVGDGPPSLVEDPDLVAFNLEGEARAWDALDEALVAEGARLVAVANGTAGSPGAWLVLVNNTTPSILSAYRTSGIGAGRTPGRLVWQFQPQAGLIQDVDINGDGRLVAIAAGDAASNKTYILLENRFDREPPRPLFRFQRNATDTDVIRLTSVALSSNLTIPVTPNPNRAAYAVVGAETRTERGIQGLVLVFETAFSPLLDRPTTSKVFELPTNTPVTRVAITADGEYALAGTQEGLLYLISVSEALTKRGASGLADTLRPWQASLGSRVTALAIARFGGEFFAAGTEGGDVVLFRSQLNPSGSEGAQGREVGRFGASACTPSLEGPVASLAMSDFGDQLVAGVRDGLIAFEAAAHARFGFRILEPAWCIPVAAEDVGTGVLADIAGDGRRVFAGSGHRVLGFRNFFEIGVEPQDGTRKSTIPGQRVQWAITVRNQGSLFDRVNLTAGGPTDPGWQFDLSNRSLLLLPGKSQTVLLNITTPPTIPPGNVTFGFTVTPERAGPAEAKALTLRLDVGQLRRVEVRPPEGTLIASAGTPNTFPVAIRNGGNALDRFRVLARIPDPESQFKSPGSDWTIRTDPVEVEVPPGSDGTVNLIVSPQAQSGNFAFIELTAEGAVPSPDGSTPQDSKRVIVAVDPLYNGDIALREPGDTRIWPGQLVFLNFTVKNLGNTRDIFLVENRTEPPNAPGWKLELSDKRFELRRANEEKVVRLNVFAQLGLQPGESLRIVVDLFSEGLQKQSPGSSGQVDSQAASVTVVPQPRRGLPLAPEPLLLAAALAAALLAARRRP